MIERKILIGLITQTEYLRQLQSDWNADYIESATARMIAQWCWEYFDKFHKAPDRDIENIFIEKLRKNLKKEIGEEIGNDILPGLSEEYEKDGINNIQYLIEQTKEYFKERQLIIHNETIAQLLSKNKINEALKLAQEFKLKTSEKDENELDLSKEIVLSKIDSAFDTTYQNVISFPGALGDFWNDQLVRGGLIGVLAPEKRGKCLPGNQKILLADGRYITISEAIEKNMRDVISFNEQTQKFIKTRISKFWRNGIKPVYEVTTKTGRVVQVTKNHPFLTPDGWKDLFEIGEGSFIATPKKLDFFGEFDMPKHKIKLAAYFLADGCALEYAYSYSKYNVVRYTKKEQAIQKDFSNCVIKMGATVSWKGNDCTINKNKKVILFLKELGTWNKKSYQKIIPDDIFKLNKEGIRLFLKTLFTGDGWVNSVSSTDYEIGYSSSSKEMVYQIQSLLLKFGIVSIVKSKKTKRKDAWNLRIADYRNTKLFVEEIGFLFEKQKRLEEAFKERKTIYKSFIDKLPWQIAKKFHDEAKQTKNDFKKAPSVREQIVKKKPLMFQSFSELESTSVGKKYFNSEILWDEIVNVAYIGEIETFDLTIEKHHNFIAENVLVHNTFWLLEFMMRAFSQNRKVAFFQAGDMTENQMLIRICVYLAKKSNKEKHCGIKYIPVQDCIKNQTDNCEKRIRECNFGVFAMSEDEVRKNITLKELKEVYEEYQDYKPCFNCVEWTKNKYGAVWLKKENIKSPLTVREAKRKVKRFFINSKLSVKLSTHVNTTLTISKIKEILNKWKTEEEFTPDIILIDYGDLIVPETRGEFRHQQNEIWKQFRGLSQEGNCLVIVPTQSDTDSYKRDRLGMDNFNEDKRKFGHVTAMYGLNQDVAGREKEIGLMRLNKIVVREDDFHVTHEVTVLQKLEIGRPFLGSYF